MNIMKHYSNFKLADVDRYEVSKLKKKQRSYKYECDDILTFDIEVTSAWGDTLGNIISYRKCLSEEYWNSLTELSLCYIWQFSYNNEVYYGRELSEFLNILNQFDKQTHYIIYVHNLAYEFQFLCNILRWKDVFARSAHKVIYAIPDGYENIEFRCSYFLTRLSLKDWGDELSVKKLDTLDYDSKIRTPKTRLTQAELDYCEHDCLVVYEGIKKYREKYTHVENISLTQTGEVRRELKKRIVKNKSLQKQMISLIPNSYMYRVMKQAFAGGYTHANYTLSNRVIRPKKLGYHFDFASSYPFCMCAYRYPAAKFVECDFDRDEDYAYIMRIRVNKVDAKTYNHYISASKCIVCESDLRFSDNIETVDNLQLDNGRVISNSYKYDDREMRQEFDLYITNVDLEIIEKTYDIDYDVVECYKSRLQFLPFEIIDYILELYENKTKLKQKESDPDFDEQQYTLYTTSKKFINSIFGMTCTDIIQDSVEFEDDEWKVDEKNFYDIEAELDELRFDNKNRTFLNYAYGLFVTAYARRNLWECMMKGDDGDNNNKIVYCDTDSIFCRDYIDFSDYNDNCRKLLQKMCDYYNIDIARTEPEDRKGVKHPLGIFTEEDTWTELVTLGAKRYCVRESHDNQLHLTVSGINKSAVAVLNNDIENFNEDLVFDKDDESVHKMLLKYINNQEVVTFNKGQYDEYECHDRYGINMRNTSYSMSMTDEYLFLVNSATVISHLECLS